VLNYVPHHEDMPSVWLITTLLKRIGMEVCRQLFLTSALHGGGWSTSHSSRLTPGESDPWTHWV